MLYLVNLLITFGLIYLWASLGLIIPNPSFHLVYVDVPAAYQALVLLGFGAFIFQIGRIILSWIYGIFVLGTLGLGCLALPVYWVFFGFMLFQGVAMLGVWTVTAAPLILLVMGLITAIAQIPDGNN